MAPPKELSSLTPTNTELETSLTAIPQSSSVDSDRLQFLEDQLQSHESTISDLDQQLQTSTAKVGNLSRQVVNLKEKLKTPWDKARRLQEDLDNREKSFLDLYSQFKTLQSEHEKLQLESSTLRSQPNPLQSTVVELTTEITRLQALVNTHSSIPPTSSFEPLVDSLTIENEQLSIEKFVLTSKLTELLSDPLVLRKPQTRHRTKRVANSTNTSEPPIVSSEIQDVQVVNLVPESPTAESSSHSKASSDDLRFLSDLAADDFVASESTLHTSCHSRIAFLQADLEASPYFFSFFSSFFFSSKIWI